MAQGDAGEGECKLSPEVPRFSNGLSSLWKKKKEAKFKDAVICMSLGNVLTESGRS